MTESTQLMSAAEVGEKIGKSEYNVNRMANESLITGVKIDGEWKFKPEDVDKYLQFMARIGG